VLGSLKLKAVTREGLLKRTWDSKDVRHLDAVTKSLLQRNHSCNAMKRIR
jgi:hypothetical protein